MNGPLLLTYGDELDVLLVQKLQSHRHVFQLHLPEGGPLVVLSVHMLVAEDLQQGDEPQAVAQVQLQIHDPLIDALQVLVDPAGEGVLLDLLPRSVLSQVLLCGRHLYWLVWLIILTPLAQTWVKRDRRLFGQRVSSPQCFLGAA